MSRTARIVWWSLYVVAFLLILKACFGFKVWGTQPARMQEVGIKAAPTSEEALKNDLKRVCRLLKVEFGRLRIPGVIWLPDGKAVRERHNKISLVKSIGELWGFYSILENKIYLSTADYRPIIFYHEMIHCVSKQLGEKLDMDAEEIRAWLLSQEMEAE